MAAFLRILCAPIIFLSFLVSHGQARPDSADVVLRFAELPSKERVKVWRDHPMSKDFRDTLIANGVDAVPVLADLVHRGRERDAVAAVHLLCDMDRFVPIEQTSLPSFLPGVSVPALNIKGRLNPFKQVDGRRIGNTGLEAIRWAEQQTRKPLGLAAQECSGDFERRMRSLSVSEQLAVWKETIERCYRRDLCVFAHEGIDEQSISTLETILAQEAPESLPLLLQLILFTLKWCFSPSRT